MSEMIKLAHEHELAQNTLSVQWLLTNICNYSCSYCPSYLNDGSSKGLDLENIKNFVFKLKSHYKDKNIFIELTGGEPTTYRYFDELLNFLKKEDIKVGILSNGGRGMEFWDRTIPKLDNLILSFHSEEGRPEHFYKLVKSALYQVPMHINVLMKPDTFHDSLKFANKLSELHPHLSISLQKLTKIENNNYTTEIVDYDLKQRLIISEQLFGKKVTTEHKPLPNNQYRGAMMAHFSDGKIQKLQGHYNSENNWKGWKCSAGIENLSIRFNGEIYRGLCKEGGLVGEVTEENIFFPSSEIICSRSGCHCGFDIGCTKVKV
jgi:organic radical activating enzyme